MWLPIIMKIVDHHHPPDPGCEPPGDAQWLVKAGNCLLVLNFFSSVLLLLLLLKSTR